MIQTIRFAARSRLDTAQFMILNPFKGTDIYAQQAVPPRGENYDYNTTDINLGGVPGGRFKILFWGGFVYFYLYRLRIIRSLLKYPRKKYLYHYLILVLSRFLANIRMKSRKI